MLNQIQTGKFIAEIRKNKNMTQKELAEKLGISDKTVSKWETGKGMPDVSIMGSLCEVLEINVNELLSGEKLSVESYSGKAEENMLNLIKKTEEEKKKQGWARYSAVMGFLLMIAVFVWVMMQSSRSMSWFIDGPSAFLLFLTISMIFNASGTARNLFQAFPICYGNKEYSGQEVGKALNAVRLLMKGIFLSGVFAVCIGLIATMNYGEDSQEIRWMIAVSLIPLLYSMILIIILLPVESRLKDKMIV